jgi:23S rRNA (uracil1939-C5)-methyltransferase
MSDEVEGTVRDLSRFGDGIVKTHEGTVFVPGVLPGERVALTGIRKQGKVMRSERARLLDRSAQRVDPPCPIVARCGGCPLMIATLPVQAKFKRELVERALRGLPGADAITLAWIGTQKTLCYRRRARMAWDASSGRARIGYRPRRSEQVTDVRSCAILDPPLDAAFSQLRRHAEHLRGKGQLQLACGKDGKPVLAMKSDDPQPPELYAALEKLVETGVLAGAALRAAGASTDATWGEPRELRTAPDGAPLWGTIAGFSQAHDEVNAALARAVVELARPAERDVLELFSGSGNLTVMLAREAKTLLAIESDEDAAAAARENLKARGLTTAVVRAEDAESYRPVQRPHVVVLDPPRKGAAGAIRRIVHAGIPEVVYVSCDPPTLSRDLKALADAGYVVTSAVALDMFPQTAHVEAVVRAEKRA